MVTEQLVEVEVAYARERAQALIPVKGQPGMTIADAIERSGVKARFPEIDLAVNKVGIFGKLAKLDQVLATGDRVEVYPPLIADPKQARKQRAADATDSKDPKPAPPARAKSPDKAAAATTSAGNKADAASRSEAAARESSSSDGANAPAASAD